MMTQDALSQNQIIRNYYEFQSAIYDATRWSFLFGRKKILKLLSFENTPQQIIEVGCGTGFNLKMLAQKFSKTDVQGIDVSKDMLTKARKKLKPYPNVGLVEKAYANKQEERAAPLSADLLLFSYALTMINPQYPQIIQQAYEDLKPGGKIAVVDFHSSKVPWFKKHMENNHVRMEGQLDPLLQQHFESHYFEIRQAYFGLWNYFLFIGVKK